MSDNSTSVSDGGRVAWLSLVGLSEAGWQELGEAARDAVLSAELVIGGERHLSHLPAVAGQQREVWPSPISEGIEWIKRRQGHPVCVLASGDPFWYGIGATLSRYLPPEAMVVHPGPSAFSLAAARLGWPLQDLHCHSLVARDPDRLRARLVPGRRLLVLSNDGGSPETVANILCESGYGESRLHVLEALGGADERVWEIRAREGLDQPVFNLNTLAIECIADERETPVALAPGRPGSDYCHDGQISAPEIRAVVMAHLAPRGGEHLWDLGTGSGAVAVEWLRSDGANRATAVDKRSDRLANVRENARRHGVGHLETLESDITEAIPQLADPDAVFIGGGASGHGVIDRCWQALPEGGRCVATAVTTEGETALLVAQSCHGGQLIRLSVDRTEALGRFNGWRSDRPITIWHATKGAHRKEVQS
ncbi:precorrin-6Y C5,15-methyltransferase (decarboxylating) [Halospina denitrificans]|uniref:Precorrin-6Y C5,15-methyltransferase (Decarboxylating) n=1 Tax=Halospina denitrificans TaxID=332522 RepID=A0A4V3EQ35_9GAMM|nr:precorrin-6y C5,15-methyltransferase (decarboxylating) subunit CbiE [Halospina denitrificans]TDT40348.1 precorrin-6Y C5,15-methyltransferase (decarboxylating) [Halospina denitrificans]